MKSVDEIRHELSGDRPVYVVRCRGCKHFEPFREQDGFCKIDGMLWQITHYCACGERKDGTDDTAD